MQKNTMETFWSFIVSFWVDGVGIGQAPPAVLGRHQFERVNRMLHGNLVDYTNNHGKDRRIYSNALGQKRDMYVYLPPGYDPAKKYPFAMFLHGAAQDEEFFFQAQVDKFDQAIKDGKLDPVILVAPDGSMNGKASLSKPATFWANSRAGNFEDYVMEDVYNFMMANYSIRPERDFHAILGPSMGGSASFALGIKHRDRFKVAIAFMPLLNLRYVDGNGDYKGKYVPEAWSFRSRMRGLEPLGTRKFFVLRFGTLYRPLFGMGNQALSGLSAINPIEIMEAYDLKDGEMDLYISYGGKDEFHIPNQVESFLEVANRRGIKITVDYDPQGQHDLKSGTKAVPKALEWVQSRFHPLKNIAASE